MRKNTSCVKINTKNLKLHEHIPPISSLKHSNSKKLSHATSLSKMSAVQILTKYSGIEIKNHLPITSSHIFYFPFQKIIQIKIIPRNSIYTINSNVLKVISLWSVKKNFVLYRTKAVTLLISTILNICNKIKTKLYTVAGNGNMQTPQT